MSDTGTVLLATAGLDVAEQLAAALPATLVPVPLPAPAPGPGAGQQDAALSWTWAEQLDRWSEDAGQGPQVPRIVVAPWVVPEMVVSEDLAETSVVEWVGRGEIPLARWWAALGVAVRWCAEGGAVVAVIERPPPLDAAGWAPATGVAEAAASMVRSLSRSQGARQVRVNAVTTPVRLHRSPLVDPAPSLSTFPGTVETEVAGAVRMLLAPDAAGVTGTVVHADCGRSW